MTRAPLRLPEARFYACAVRTARNVPTRPSGTGAARDRSPAPASRAVALRIAVNPITDSVHPDHWSEGSDAGANRRYVDVRALPLDPVELRGILWRDGADRTRWAPSAFLPPSDDLGHWLINLEELPSAVPTVQAALYQSVLDRNVREYELPEGATLNVCGNRETDRSGVH